jgi:hypothetical protein
VGVDILSNSWGGSEYSEALREAIQDAHDAGMLFVASAGNHAENNDILPHYPSSYDVGNVVAVAATDHADSLAAFSCFGPTSVDLAAPGVDILSTIIGGDYDLFSGTSMAAPHVAGVAALMRSVHTSIDVDSLKALLLLSADPVADLAGRCVTGGRLCAYRAVAGPETVPPDPIDDLVAFDPGSNTMTLTWTATGDDGSSGTAARYHVRYSTFPLDEYNFYGATRAGNEPEPRPPGSTEQMIVTGLDFNTTYYFAVKVFDKFGNESPISNVAVGTTLGIPNIDVTPESLAETLTTGQRSRQTLRILNSGEGTLDFSVLGVKFDSGQSPAGGCEGYKEGYDAPWSDYDGVEAGVLGGHETGLQGASEEISALAGPDGFGYWWIDSDDAGGPAFDWIDVSSLGTPIPLAGEDGVAGPFAVGFPFPFYGCSFDSFYICTNGFISFTYPNALPENCPIPSAEAPFNMIAPFWDDLVLSGDETYMYYDGSRTIIGYEMASGRESAGPYTFEVILYPSGEIVFQYLSMGPPTDSATLGIQNASGSAGLQVAHNEPYIHDRLAVRVWAINQWLNVPPISGRLYAAEQTDIDVAFDATAVAGGHYRAEIIIESNDPNRGAILLPVTLHVADAPDILVGGAPVTVSSTQEFHGRAASTNHVFPAPALVGGPGSLKVDVQGDFLFDDAYATIYVEGTAIGTVGGAGWICGFAIKEFNLSFVQLRSFLADGAIDVTVQNNVNVGGACCTRLHTIELSYRELAGALDFGPTYVGFPDTMDVLVQNVGTEVLSVTDIQSSDPAFVISHSTLELDPGSTQKVEVVFAPSGAGHCGGTLSVESNDPDAPFVSVELSGEGLEPPIVSVVGDSLVEQVFEGQVMACPFFIANDGGSDLTFRLAIRGRIGDWRGDAASFENPRVALEFDSQTLAPAPSARHMPSSSALESWAPGARPLPVASNCVAQAIGAFADALIVYNESGYYDWEANIELLEANNLSYDTVRIRDLSDTDIEPYRLIILPSEQPRVLWKSLTTQRSKFEDYLNRGGVLELHAAPSTWVGLGPSDHVRPGQSEVVLPGGVEVSNHIDNVNYVSAPGHPLVLGVLSPVINRYIFLVSTGYFTSVPPEALVVCTRALGDPTLVAHRIGDGLLIASTQRLERGYSYNDATGRILSNMIKYADEVSGAPWLGLESTGGTVAVGQTLDLKATLDASDLDTGEYHGSVIVFSDDPERPRLVVPICLNVVPAPDIFVNLEELDFGPQFVGFSTTREICVKNEGLNDLEITGIMSDNAEFLPDSTHFDLPPGGYRYVEVTFYPVSEGPKSGSLIILSNDPDEPELRIPLAGEGLVPPDIQVEPDSLIAACHPELPNVKTLSVQNTGGSDLAFEIGRVGPGGGDVAGENTSRDVDLPLHAEQNSGWRLGIGEESAPLDEGGPDAFGHCWSDSDDPDGPVFDWVDITRVGTKIPMSEQNENAGPFPIGFDFPFYGEKYTTFRVCTNGFISLTSSSSPYDNCDIPSTLAPRNLIAPWWDNLDFGGVDRVYYHSDGTRLIVEYFEVPRVRRGGPYTFEVILYPDGTIVFQYLSMVSMLDGATIGIQNAAGDDGLEICYNSEYVHDNLAVIISSAEWLAVSPAEGTIPAGGSAELDVVLDARDMLEGVYDRNIYIMSNDPYKPEIAVPVHMIVRVVQATYVDVAPDALNRNSKGKWISACIELPSDFDPSAVLEETVRMENSVSVDPGRSSTGDVNHNRVEDITFKFSRRDIVQILTDGDRVPVTLVGEIDRAAWFTASDTIRVFTQGSDTPEVRHHQEAPRQFALFQNSPNPAMNVTAIAFDLPKECHVDVKIFDATGGLVRVLADRRMDPGRHSVLWDGLNQRGRRAGAGVYFYHIDAGSFRASRKLILLQ